MIKVTVKKILLIYLLVFLLVLSYILSFTVFDSEHKNKAQSQQIVFISQTDISQIDGFIIQNQDDVILLNRQNDMWLMCNALETSNKIPADVNTLQNLFLTLAATHNVTKAGNKEQLISYGLDDSQCSSITIIKNGQVYHTLLFGNLDFSQSHVYFTDEELNSVYLIDDAFQSYLNTSTQTWSDPYIISEQLRNSVFQTGEIQSASIYDYSTRQGAAHTTEAENWSEISSKLLELRHGGFAPDAYELTKTESPLVLISLETGAMAQIQLEIYNLAQNDNEYIIKTSFKSELIEKEFYYFTAVSLWTYNKIMEIML